MKSNKKWIFSMFVITFLCSMMLGGLSNTVIANMNVVFAIFILVLIIFIGIVFDIIGMAVATCDESPFHAKAARKKKGAKQTIKLLKAKDRTSNFCNDLMGDICGIVSGSTSALIAVKLSELFGIDIVLISLVMSAIVASATVGLKAIGKTIGINNAESIMRTVGIILSVFDLTQDDKKKTGKKKSKK